jgi:hypothetical protein
MFKVSNQNKERKKGKKVVKPMTRNQERREKREITTP